MSWAPVLPMIKAKAQFPLLHWPTRQLGTVRAPPCYSMITPKKLSMPSNMATGPRPGCSWRG